jgi:hypothetical protein
MGRKYAASLALCCVLLAGGCEEEPRQIPAGEISSLLAEKGYGIMAEEYVEPMVIPHGLSFYGLAESGFDDKLLTLNSKGEFSYINIENPERPELEVLSPGFPGVGGQLISDAENRVAWVVRGRGVYFIDLDSLKTGHMIAGNYGRVIQVLLADKEQLLFNAVVFSGEIMIVYAYELSTGTDHGEVDAVEITRFNTLGRNQLLMDTVVGDIPKYTGWYLVDGFLSEFARNPGATLPGGDPLTKALTEHNVHAVNEIDEKLLHQRKRLLFAWSYIDRMGPIQPVLASWDENLDNVRIEPLILQMQNTQRFSYREPTHISGDGNWMKSRRIHKQTQPRIEELVVYHLQDYYPQGMSMPVSLGYTNNDPGSFMNHSRLGPCYIEQPLSRDGILLLYQLNDAVEILRRQALGAVSDLSQGSRN